MKKIFCVVICLIVMMMSSVFAIEFSDLQKGHWAYDNVMSLVSKGVINGYPDGTYKPSGLVTRAEFFKLLGVASEGEEYFKQLKEIYPIWYLPYTFWVSYNDYLMPGTDIENTDTTPMTRVEMAVVLSRVYTGKNLSKVYTEDGDIASARVRNIEFGDISGLSEFEQNSIKYVANHGLINGYEDGCFRPDNNMTRAEVAAVIYRFMKVR